MVIVSVIRATDDLFTGRPVSAVLLLSRQCSAKRQYQRWTPVDGRRQGLEDDRAPVGLGTFWDSGNATDNGQALLCHEVGARCRTLESRRDRQVVISSFSSC